MKTVWLATLACQAFAIRIVQAILKLQDTWELVLDLRAIQEAKVRPSRVQIASK